VKLGSDFDDAFDKIRVQTGATGKNLEALQGDFKTTLSQVPSSMDDVSTAIGTLNAKLGLTGKPLQDLSVQFLNLSHVTGTDLAKDIDSATGLFNQFGVATQDQGTKLDELFRVTQHTGISFADLSTQMSDSGTVLRGVGLDFEQSAALIGLLAKNGLQAADVVPAIGKALATAAKDGKPAQDVFRETFDAIKNAPSDTAAAGDAVAVFGAKAGPKFAALIREGKLGYEEFTTAISSGGDSINGAAADTADFAEKLDLLKNKVLVALEPAVSSAFDTMTTVVDGLGSAFDALPAPVVGVIGDIALFGTAALGAAGAVSFIAGQVGKLFDVVKGAGDAIHSLGKIGPELAAVGPYALSTAGVLAGLGLAIKLVGDQNAANARVTEEYTQVLQSQTAELDKNSAAFFAKALTDDKTAAALAKLGISSKDFETALRTGGAATDAFSQRLFALKDAGGDVGQSADDLLTKFGELGQGMDQASATSINAALANDKLGRSAVDAAGKATLSAQGYQDLQAALSDGVLTAGEADRINGDLSLTLGALNDAAANTGASTATAAGGLTAMGTATAGAIQPTKDLTAAANAHAQAVKDELQALSDAAKAQQDQVDAQRAAADAGVAVGKAEDDQATFLAGLSTEITDAQGNQQKLNDINREAVDHAQALADATNTLADQQAKASGTTVSATGKLDTWNATMLTSASHLSGPVQEAVLGHIAAVNGIPPEKLTDIQALINAGDIAGAEAALNTVSRARAVAVTADTTAALASLQAVIDKMNQIHDKTVHVNAVGGVNVNGTEASGGPINTTGMYLVGEKGPEIVSLPNGAYVHNNSDSRAMLAGIKGFADGGFVGGITGPVTGGAPGATRGTSPQLSAGTLHDLFGPGGRYSTSGPDPLDKLFGRGTDFANWIITGGINSAGHVGMTLQKMFSYGTDFYTAAPDALEQLFGSGADFAGLTARDPKVQQILPVWIPPNSVPATPIDQTPQNYSSYAGVKTSAPYMGPVGTGATLLDPAQVAAINEAGLDEFGRVRLPSSPGWRPIGVGPNDYRAPAGTVINVYMPPGSDGEDVVAALKRYQRRNGVIPVSTL
jgi:hypothetical protein